MVQARREGGAAVRIWRDGSTSVAGTRRLCRWSFGLASGQSRGHRAASREQRLSIADCRSSSGAVRVATDAAQRQANRDRGNGDERRGGETGAGEWGSGAVERWWRQRRRGGARAAARLQRSAAMAARRRR
ncbi:hypothetical protein EUGRSUZ_C03077 [Eucalyptus grandis]|uniref:Uncharacterized protein n=2 Tax=Eucalyptus grandis TaxID=71139 RepID=A0ACC3LI24_EUCGR|nr:hypothetical protein EUGRSUZ_C03077 [Eucalyptus grandis]